MHLALPGLWRLSGLERMALRELQPLHLRRYPAVRTLRRPEPLRRLRLSPPGEAKYGFYAEETMIRLESHVDPCTHCGACMSFCAWDQAEAAGRPAGPELCRPCQVCYRICPRLPYDAGALARAISPDSGAAPWGQAIGAYTARAAERPAGVQDGGIVTLLAEHLLAAGQVQAVLVTGRGAEWRPRAYWATDAEGIVRAVGSKYSAAPALTILSDGLERSALLAVIALPCQAAALARFMALRPELRERIALVVGLFCTETFSHDELTGLVEERLGRPMADVERFDIKRGRFFARAGGEPTEWRIKELNDAVWPICLGCPDLTAELADVSIGSIGSAEGANSVIVRSERGCAAVDGGVAAGLWTLAPLENSEALQKQCERKRGAPSQLPADERSLTGRSSVRGNWKRRTR